MDLKRMYLIPSLLCLLAGCGETEADISGKGDVGTKTPPGAREVVLSLQNKLLAGNVQSRAADIATTDEKRIDALDIYVFGSMELDGNYTFQEKFSYRSDGSVVEGSTAIEVEGGDGSTANPTVLLRPRKGLYIKFYCVANQPGLYRTDDTGTQYVKYDNFVPLVQTAPGDPDLNTITEGIPTETEFRQFTAHVIDPGAADDNLVPALVMSGAHTAPIDLHDFSLASRLYARLKLRRAVARFDIVNKAEESRFTIEAIGLGNGRATSTLFPQEALPAADGKLVTYPLRDVTGVAGLNTGAATPAFYSYASPAGDKAFLVLKGKYHLNLVETADVNYNVNFSQVKDGTGASIEINPNHRYTVTITDADPYRIDFNISVADWEEGDDLGEYDPENGMDDLTVTPADLYNEDTRTVSLSVIPGSDATVTTASNAPIEAQLLYTTPGNDWLQAEVTMTPVTRTVWTQNAQCVLTAKDGVFTAYPNAILRLVNTASGEYNDLTVTASGVHLGEVKPVVATYNSYDETNRKLTMYGTDGAEAKVTLYCPNGLADITGLPEWLTETHVQNGGATNYTFKLKSDKFPADLLTADATHTVTFTDKVDATASDQLIFLLKSSAINKAGAVLEEQPGTTGNSYSSTADNETVSMTCTNTSATSFELTIPSARGITLSGNDFGWFTVAHTTRWSEGTPKDVFRFNSKTGQISYTDKDLTFTNNIIGGGDFKLKVTAGVFVGAVTPTGTASAYNSYTSASSTLTLYAFSGNAATVKVFAPANLTVSGTPSWLKVTPSVSSGYTTYTLALQNLTSAAYGSTTLTFTSNSDTTKKTSITVTLKSPAINTAFTTGGTTANNSYTPGTSPTTSNGFASTGAMTLNVATTASYILTVSSPYGTSINSTYFTWFSVTKTKSWTKESPTEVYSFQVQTGVVLNSIGTATLKFSSNITGGGTHTVTVSRNTNTLCSPAVSGFPVETVGSYYMSVGYSGPISDWSEANRLCSNGGNGWRLPTIQELGSLTGYSEGFTSGHPAGNYKYLITQNANFFSNSGNYGGYYMWTKSPGKGGSAYYTFIADKGYATFAGETNNTFVRCIRNK